MNGLWRNMKEMNNIRELFVLGFLTETEVDG